MWDLKRNDTNELTNDSKENELMAARGGKGRDSQGVWDGYVHTAIVINTMDNQQGLIVQHMELCSMLCASLHGRGFWGSMDTCTCMAESLR